jgi:hypothetical protein
VEKMLKTGPLKAVISMSNDVGPLMGFYILNIFIEAYFSGALISSPPSLAPVW